MTSEIANTILVPNSSPSPTALEIHRRSSPDYYVPSALQATQLFVEEFRGKHNELKAMSTQDTLSHQLTRSRPNVVN